MVKRHLPEDEKSEVQAPASSDAAPAQERPIADLDPKIAQMSHEDMVFILKTLAQRDEARERMRARMVLCSGGIRPTDLRQMVRGQIIHGGPGRACRRDEDEWDGDFFEHLPVWPRTVEQPYTDPVRTPPNELLCPLEQRGDETVPCTEIQRRVAEEEGVDPREDLAPDPERELRSLCRGDFYPCRIFHDQARTFLRDNLARPQRAKPDQVPAPPEGNRPEMALQLARYLVNSERMDSENFIELLERGIYILGPRWLPCQDDSQRDQFYSLLSPPADEGDEADEDEADEEDDEEADEDDDEDETREVPPGRMRCPLQVRALLGDRTVACAEAQVLHPAESLVRAAKEAFPNGPATKDRSVNPTYGTPDDPVRRLGLRPCQLLGQILAHDLIGLLGRLKEDRAWLERDRQLFGETEDEPEAESSWTAGVPAN